VTTTLSVKGIGGNLAAGACPYCEWFDLLQKTCSSPSSVTCHSCSKSV